MIKTIQVLTTVGVVALASSAEGQTALSTLNVGGGAIQKTAGLSVNNPWLGAQVGYKFGGSSEFADNLLASARVLYNIDVGSKRFALPVVGNISSLTAAVSSDESSADQLAQKAQQLIVSTQGMHVGVYPYFKAIEKTYFSLTIHGGLAWKINALQDTANATAYMQQGRLFGGFEFGIGKSTPDREHVPLTVSITPTVTLFNADIHERIFGARKSSISSLDLTGVVPVGRGLGFLAEGVLPRKSRSAFRAGLIFAFEAQ